MMKGLSAMVLGCLICAPTLSHSEEGRHVDGLLLISSDAKVVKKAKADWRYQEPFSALAKQFPGDRFVISEWGKRSAIVLDLKVGPLGSLRRSIAAARKLLAQVRADGTLNLKDLDDEQAQALDSPASSLSGGTAEGMLGLYAEVNFTVRLGGETKSFAVPIQNSITKERNKVLGEHPLVVHGPKAGLPVRQPLAPETGPKDEVGIHLFGLASTYLGEGMREASALIDRERTRLDGEQATVGVDLLRKLGLAGDPLAMGEVPLNDLPKGLKDGLMDGFANSWRSLGFGSLGEAETFLLNSNSVQMSTSLGLMHCSSPGDPSNHVPWSGGVIVFGTIKGGVGPQG